MTQVMGYLLSLDISVAKMYLIRLHITILHKQIYLCLELDGLGMRGCSNVARLFFEMEYLMATCTYSPENNR